MATYSNDLLVTGSRYGQLDVSQPRAWHRQDCPHCGAGTLAVIACDQLGEQIWARCTNCRRPIVIDDGVVSPAMTPLVTPAGLPDAERTLWEEARSCLSVGASTSAVMACRKILLHMAVGFGLPAKNEKDRSPTYAAAVQHLEDAGVITKLMRDWVDRVKDVGNEANHEIELIDTASALDVARFTEQLLRLAYEMTYLMNAPKVNESELPPTGQ